MRVLGAQRLAALALLLSPLGLSQAQDRPIVAVFQIEDKSGKLSARAIDQLTDYLGTLMATRGYQVVPRSQLKARILAAKRASYQQDCDESCQIELGKEVAAQKSLAAQVLKIGSQCRITLNLFDLKRAAVEAAGMASGGCAEDDVVSSLDRAVAAMLGGPVPADPPPIGPAPGKAAGPADLAQACLLPLEPEGVEGLDLSEGKLNQLAMAVKRRAGAAGPELARLTGCLGFLRLQGEHRRVLALPVILPGAPADMSHLKKKLEAVSNLTRKYEENASKADPFWRVASVVRYGEVMLDLASSLLNSPAPPKLGPEEREVYFDLLQQQALPIEERASAALRQALEVARLAGLSNGWTRRAEAALSRLAPPPAPAKEEDGAALAWIFSRPAGIEFTRSEITVAQYRVCAAAGKCSPPDVASGNQSCNWDLADRDSHPVNCVDWDQASAFCEWAGARLPTEQEWFAEASDGGDRQYPWGDEVMSCERVIWKQGESGCGRSSTWPVCSKPAGNSVSGLCDMNGNVWEWTSSLEGSVRVLRGGSWTDTDPSRLRASSRLPYNPAVRDADGGFRCVRSAQ